MRIFSVAFLFIHPVYAKKVGNATNKCRMASDGQKHIKMVENDQF